VASPFGAHPGKKGGPSRFALTSLARNEINWVYRGGDVSLLPLVSLSLPLSLPLSLSLSLSLSLCGRRRADLPVMSPGSIHDHIPRRPAPRARVTGEIITHPSVVTHRDLPRERARVEIARTRRFRRCLVSASQLCRLLFLENRAASLRARERARVLMIPGLVVESDRFCR